AFSSTFCANIYKGCRIEDSIKFDLINASHVIQHSDAKSGLQTSKSLEKIKSKMNCGLDKKITVTAW
ncbi:carbohydrate kinase family protein, partial [Francisella tularensis subsp. holarctica]|nr:carbohydrate kinase family protein [Francisella tularensis subsp. holarctica]